MTASAPGANKKSHSDSRASAARCLAAVADGASLSRQLPVDQQGLSASEHALYRQLCYGVLRFYHLLNAATRKLVNKPLKAKDRDIWMLLLLGAYQLHFSRVPAHAAISATVDATRTLKKPWAKGLINGVLRQWQRQGEALLDDLDAASRSAHPDWLFQQLNVDWPEQSDAILAANNLQGPLTLRVNRQRSSRSEYQSLLEEAGIDALDCRFSTAGIQLKEAVSIDKLPDFAEGSASVQDEAAQLAASLLQLAPEQTVLDACAAPGGKTCHLLETEPTLAVTALDVDNERLARVNDNLQRLDLRASVVVGDASDLQWWDKKSYDRILLDAPCSATGVIRRNPDIKLHRRPDDIHALTQLQARILQNLWQTLKPGGLLLYATCSILKVENEQQIARFCQEHNDAVHEVIDASWGEARPFGRQLFPTIEGHDGFYYALLRKIS